jgi:peptide/nickel transport system ATP-binding protein
MQIIFQDPYSSLDPRKTVSEIIAEPLKICRAVSSKAELNEKVFEMMDTVGLSYRFVNSYPHELDGGRRQRIGVARALSVNPGFVVCDEPVSALDMSIQAQILNLMMDLQESLGLTYMFITHDMSVVKHISEDIMVMYMGKCVEISPAKELFKKPAHPYTKALLEAIPAPNLSRRGKKRNIIKGEVTSPINPAPGCRFAPRCPHASGKCTAGDIALKDLGGNHFAACVLL